MSLKYPESTTTIDEMCKIIDFFRIRIKDKEYTDCTIVYTITFDQLRTIYNLGKDHGKRADQQDNDSEEDEE